MFSRLGSDRGIYQGPVLKPESHKFDSVILEVVRNSQQRGERMSSLQLDAIQRYKSLVWDDSASDISLVREVFHVFDGLFFFNRLGRSCILMFGAYNEKLLGVTDRLLWGTRPPFIMIYRHIVVENATKQSKRVLYMAGTVLHEMIHAYLRLFLATSCELRGMGKTGHGFAWQEIAYALEIAINDPLLIRLPYRIRSGRKVGLMEEMEKCSASVVVDANRWELGTVTGTKVTKWNMAWNPRNWVTAARKAMARVNSPRKYS